MRSTMIAKSLPLHRQVYEYLRDQFIYGKVACGEKLVESKIAKELNVSRSPIREALRMLCTDELLIDTGDGLIVNPMDYESSAEVYESRIVMEPFAARLAAERIDEETLKELEQCVTGIENYRGQITEENFPVIVELNSQFHALIVQACKHHIMQKYLNNNLALMSLVRNNEFYDTIHDENFIDEHKEIYESIKEHDAKRAEESMRKHVTADYELFKRNNK